MSIEQLKTHASNMGFRLTKIPVKKPDEEKAPRAPPLKSRVREVVLAKGRATEKLQALKDLVGVPVQKKTRKPRKKEPSPPPTDDEEEEEDVEEDEEEDE